ncbi:glycoside hydrolase family 25 protein [Amycolatopsis circi]|uniref:glycoside hydrolase family 25 protein n=1 Tax=Amycolatopsis circi TaxID=871959 RepID=UPI000E22C916|nr:glycoside hydrolase family 25 protein [Amycolatopsis circi]
MLYGIDISHHQGGAFDLRRTRAEGFDFAFLKATDGTGWVDPQFGRNLGEARGAGLLVAAYHYQRGNASAAAQVDTITRTVPRDVPVIPDVEKDGGNLALTRDIVARLRGAGYTVPLVYVPRWYWRDTLGSPALDGLPPLWSSRYPDMKGGYASQIYERVPANYWDGYGGAGVEVLQFTSSATVAGHTPVDANAYRGTRDQLAALLSSPSQPQKEVDMPAIPVSLPYSADWNYVALPFESNANSTVVGDAWFTIFAAWGEVEYEVVTIGGGLKLVGLIGTAPTTGRLADRQRNFWQVPSGLEGIALRYRARNAKGEATNGRIGYSFPQKGK